MFLYQHLLLLHHAMYGLFKTVVHYTSSKSITPYHFNCNDRPLQLFIIAKSLLILIYGRCFYVISKYKKPSKNRKRDIEFKKGPKYFYIKAINIASR